MALTVQEADWTARFTAGAVQALGIGPLPEKSKAENLEEKLRRARDKEEVKEQALKDMLLEKTLREIDKRRELLRETTQATVERVDDGGKKKTEQLRDKEGKQQRATDTGNMKGVTNITYGSTGKGGKDTSGSNVDTSGMTPQGPLTGGHDDVSAPFNIKQNAGPEAKGLKLLSESVAWVQGQADELAEVTVMRSTLPDGADDIVLVKQKLFTDKELTDEIFTPLVRDKVLGETLVPDKYSKTQQMLDGSDDYYIKECKEKGRAPATGAAELTKGLIGVAGSVATTVFSGMGAVKEGQDAMNNANWSEDQVAQYNDITNGIVAVLQGGIDLTDKGIEAYKVRDFDESAFSSVVSNIGNGIGKMVAGATGNEDIGGIVQLAIDGSAKLVQISVTMKKWATDPNGDPPVAAMLSIFGGVLADGFSTLSDLPNQTTDQCNAWANIGTGISAAFGVLAKGAETKVILAIKNGNWKEAFAFVEEAAGQAAKAADAGADTNNLFDSASDLSGQDSALKDQNDFNSAADSMQKALNTLSDLKKDLDDPLLKTKREQTVAAGRKKIEEMKKAADEAKKQATKEEIKAIQERLAEEKKEDQTSLKCLGSRVPDDLQDKTIAKLIEQIERDRAIWDGLNAMFGAGIGLASGVTEAIATVASSVAPPLKAAGQLMKFIINLKAAADRCEAWLTWREGRKDAVSAVSPYATSIENFIQNQGTQFAHYSIQAAANAINALLSAAEMSPVGPAFTAASAGVTASAALEDTLYKFKKQQDLRKAWRATRKALDPANKGDRRMRLLVREMNPTLAKYTIAYGALIDEDPIAITAMNRVGLDRETLARAGDGVKDVKKYLETLYPDDGTVLVKLAFEAIKTKLPDPALTSKTWQLTFVLLQRDAKLAGQNPPEIVGNLSLVETLKPKVTDKVERGNTSKTDIQNDLIDALKALNKAFLTFRPVDTAGEPIEAVKEICRYYADLAAAAITSVEMDIEEAETQLKKAA